MAARIPLIIKEGEIQQLQAGDTLDASQVEIETVTLANGEANALVICTVVYSDADDSAKRAIATAVATSEVVGFATAATVAAGQPATVQTSGAIAATTGQWDAMAAAADSQSGGLTVGTVYYLDETTAGKYTKTGTDTVGSALVRLGIAISTTEMLIGINEPILL
jgi:hypothetical protein